MPPRDEAALEILREEAREVITAQLRQSEEIDSKALETIKVIAVLVGLVVSAAAISETPSLYLTVQLVQLGGILLFASFVVSITAYSSDRPYVGVGDGKLERHLQESPGKTDVLEDLVRSYSSWIHHNNRELATDYWYLVMAQILLICGFSVILLGVALEASPW